MTIAWQRSDENQNTDTLTFVSIRESAVFLALTPSICSSIVEESRKVYVTRLLLVLLILFTGNFVFAQTEWNYSQFPIVAPQANDILPSELNISKVVYHGMMPRGSGTHPFWGVEQVYSDRKMTKRLFVKRDVQLTIGAHSGWMKVGNGFVMHLKQGTKLNAFYALGFDSRERLEIERQLRGIYRTASLLGYLVPDARAEELVNAKKGEASAPAADKAGAENEGSEGLTMCIGTMTGKIIGNKVSSAYNSASDAVSYAYNDKLGAVKAVGSYVGGAATGAWDATKSAVSATASVVAHPVDAWGNVVSAVDSTRRFGNEIYQKTASTIQDFPTWPQPVKDIVTCTIAAELVAGGAELVAGFLTGAGESMAAIRAAKLLASIYERIKALSPVIKLLIASKEGSWSSRLSLLKDLVKGTKTREEVELALRKAAPAATEVGKDAVKVSDLKALNPDDLAKLQAKNRALSDADRMAAIEKQLGLPPGSLTDAQKKKLLDIHNKPCAATACTAQEIKDIKDLKVVREMFPDASPQNIKDLYRGNLLGYEKDEFASLMKQPLKPRAEFDEGAHLRSNLDAHTTELQQANTRVAKLQADPDHSPIALADAKHQQENVQASVNAAQRDLQQHSIQTTPAASTDDHELHALLKQSFKPSAPKLDAVESEQAAAAHARQTHALLDKHRAAQDAAKAANAPITEADKKEFDQLLHQSFKPSASAKSASEKLSAKLSEATSDHPVGAKYVSAKTGEVVNADIIGMKNAGGALDAHGEVDQAARVLIRTTGQDGRVTTREVALRDLAFGKDNVALRNQGGARSAEHAVDRMVERATGSADRIRELDQQSQAAVRAPGALKPGSAWDKAETEKTHLLKADQPLTHTEVRHVQAVHEAFTAENVAARMPLQITKTGNVKVRSGERGINRAGLNDAEKRDLAHAKGIVESRHQAARSVDDAEHFDKINKLDERKIVLGRLQSQEYAALKRISAFTQTNDHALPRFAREYDPVNLAKAYSSPGQSVKASLRKVHDLVSKSSLDSNQARELRDNLQNLRVYGADESSRANTTLNKFLDYAADRAGYQRLEELKEDFLDN